MWSRVGGGLSMLLARPPLEARSLCLVVPPQAPKSIAKKAALYGPGLRIGGYTLLTYVRGL